VSEYPIKLPKTDDEWFALIEPEITSNPVEVSRSEIISLAKQHATQVVNRTPLNTSVDAIEWNATRELGSKHGYHRSSDTDDDLGSIKLSVYTLERCGWQEFMRVVRHELVHAWQSKHDQYNEEADTHFDRTHGEEFEKWMDILSIRKTGPRVLPDWTIECPTCHTVVHRINESRRKPVAERLSELRPITCSGCENELTEFQIKCQGYELPQDECLDIPTSRDNTTDSDNKILLYNNGDLTRSSDPPSVEWDPEIRSLTDLPGIGEATASTIGSHIYSIEDLIDENATDGTVAIAEEIQDAVSAQYHDVLRTEINQWYEEAQSRQTGEIAELLTRVIEETEHEWWEPVERIDGTGQIEALNLLLCDEVEAGDRLQVRFEDAGEYPVRVVEKEETEDRTGLDVVIEADPPSINSEGTIIAQYTSQGKPPYYRYEKRDKHIKRDDIEIFFDEPPYVELSVTAGRKLHETESPSP
jgi:hypothetical protein